MWLLDANVDVHLAPLLNEFGVACDIAANRGWKALENGDLVAAAVAAGFDCILTRDQAFAESAARALFVTS
jgi:predicted nuclease of predicted toxin-antitoxin system